MINPLLKSLIAEFGVTFAYYIISKHGQKLINKLDKTIVDMLEGIVTQGKEFQYYCPKCKQTMELFSADLDKEHVQLQDKCKHCESDKIYLKVK